MHWKTKARIMKACAALPAGDGIYTFLQKHFGNLNADPSRRLPTQVEMASWLRDGNFEIAGKSFFEVGTGHKPVLPIGFFLMGAANVTTVDINRRLDMSMLKATLNWITQHRQEVELLYLPFVDAKSLDDRFDIIRQHMNAPEAFLQAANIDYLAPMDAADTGLPAASFDCHVSTTVLEHISADVLPGIFREARRLLRDDGLALHFIDLSDHFQHQDADISRINFLRYSDAEWASIAGNQFAYTNRMRAGDYTSLVGDAGFEIARDERIVDDASIAALEAGFEPDAQFATCDTTELCTTSLRLLMKKS